MFGTCLRLALLLATLLASAHGAAAPRVWKLTDVRLSDGAIATGYLVYDDATRKLESFNVSLGGGMLAPHTHVLDNSIAYALTPPQSQWFQLYFYSSYTDPFGQRRSLRITPLTPLDGSSVTVPIDVSGSKSYDYYESYYYTSESRPIVAGSLVLTALPPPPTTVQVDEFYQSALRHYFVTADAAEKQALDTGVHPGWQRTGESFKAYAPGSSASGSINPVCRFYDSPPAGTDSHFYSAHLSECFVVLWTFEWHMEAANVFQINLPDAKTGACPSGTVPVYRLWNQRPDSNHRYTTSVAIKAQMIASGYLAEGYGPDGVVMCAVQ